MGEKIEVAVHGLGHGGEGVARYEGFTLFIPGGVPGDVLDAEVIEVKPSFGRARLLRVRRPSPDRVAPPCPVVEECGGCPLQHVAYPAQLALKRQQVVDALARIGRLPDVPVHPTRGMADPWRYRNKGQFPVGWRGGRVIAGFFAPGTHRIVDVEGCETQHPLGNRIVQEVKALAQRFGVRIYDEKRHRGVLRHVLVRVAPATGEALAVLVTNGPDFPHAAEIAAALLQCVPGLVGVVQNVNPARTNVVLGPESRVLAGAGTLTDRIGDLSFTISPVSFFQVNPVQTEVLYDTALRYAGLTGNEVVLDVYGGIGTIALFLARHAARVVGIEVVPEAVADARANAKRNGIANAAFRLGDAAVELPRLVAEGIRADVVVVDPPRKGCDEAVLDAMAAVGPARIVYVSCNPASLARDLAHLARRGYRTVEVQPVDMFPHTAHVECCALLVREAGGDLA